MSSNQDEEPITPEEIRKEANLLERLQNFARVNDNFQAALVSQNARLVRLAQQQKQLLEALGGGIEVEPPDVQPDIEVVVDKIQPVLDLPEDFEPSLSVDVDEFEIDEARVTSAVLEALEQQKEGVTVAFPERGTPFSLPRGTGAGNRHEFDLVSGSLSINGAGSRNTQNSLSGADSDVSTSAHIWADGEVVVFTFDSNDDLTGVFELDKWHTTIESVVMTRVEIDAENPVRLAAQFSTGTEPPTTPQPVAGNQERFGHITTSQNNLQNVTFVGPNSGDYGEDTLRDAVDNFGRQDIYGGHTGLHHFIVQNTSGNDAEVQARIVDIDGQQEVADVDIHGSVDTAASNVVTVSANDFALLESGGVGRTFRLLAQAAVGGNQIDLDVQYFGTSPSTR